ncbi:MAG: hypothetical protein GX660_18165 [Clostridiaceae bacterium]|nr:hypothetical protein [Clostridiaceae bacterium]
MRELKVAKYQIRSTLGPIVVFYAIFVSVIVLLAAIFNIIGDEASSSGLESSTVVFLFVAGLNSFKGNFKLFQANNVSRKTFVKGLIIGVLPITFAMSLLDLIIIRIYNFFGKCPTNFDMIYGDFRYSGENWIQSNDLQTLFGTVIWQFAVYSVVFILGILISLCYYRSNNRLKIVISVVPLMLLGLLTNASQVPEGSSIRIGNFIASAFGWQNQNPYMAVFTLAVLGTLFSIAIYLLSRRAVLKD